MGRYRVTASTRVLGHEPNSVFDADLSPEHEARLLASGALKHSRAKHVDDDDDQTTNDDDGDGDGDGE